MDFVCKVVLKDELGTDRVTVFGGIRPVRGGWNQRLAGPGQSADNL